ncbi:DUF4265 domain-containing protein [Streptomyces kunmingensis]|uniref:DUF4265 domain-containing protein n=2 Tax=Streptomyces kunmingensis TaxID=68225 RepID=A0ABU6CEA9_9ACTN|nr:DUF4265 domain-containing protein [Streptomyces kunmingensis]MEB3962715.1 DUF4265 domain-containing protein [Streptomyces kunmingensis]
MDIDAEGRPPASAESLWAVDLGDGTVRLDSTPRFVRGVASDDVIRVEIDYEASAAGRSSSWAGGEARGHCPLLSHTHPKAGPLGSVPPVDATAGEPQHTPTSGRSSAKPAGTCSLPLDPEPQALWALAGSSARAVPECATQRTPSGCSLRTSTTRDKSSIQPGAKGDGRRFEKRR